MRFDAVTNSFGGGRVFSKPVEIVLAHVITQFMVLLVQIGAMLAVALEGTMTATSYPLLIRLSSIAPTNAVTTVPCRRRDSLATVFCITHTFTWRLLDALC